MNTLEDIAALKKEIGQATNEYFGRGSLNFYGSTRVWEGMLSMMNERLGTEYKIPAAEKPIDESELHPYLVTFRNLYLTHLTGRPESIDQCVALLQDMTTTLKTSENLHQLAPFHPTPHGTQSFHARYMQKREMMERDLPQILALERQSIARRNALTGSTNEPWDKNMFTGLMTDANQPGKKQAIAQTAYLNTQPENFLGYYCMRRVVSKTADEGWEVRAYGSKEIALVPERLTQKMLGELLLCRKKLVDCVQMAHF